MDDEEHTLRHELKNAEQEKLALKSLVKRAADEIENLAEADCSEPAIEKAKFEAERMRKAASTSKSGE